MMRNAKEELGSKDIDFDCVQGKRVVMAFVVFLFAQLIVTETLPLTELWHAAEGSICAAMYIGPLFKA
jgi:hypothetical protein